MINKNEHLQFRRQMPEWFRLFMSEFIGSFIRVFLVLSTLLVVNLIPNTVTSDDLIYNANLFCIYIIAITFSSAGSLLGTLMLSVPVSGGYLNPGISLCLATMSRLDWKRLLFYIPAQYFGSFFAAFLIHVVFYEHMDNKLKSVITHVMIITPHPRINLLTAILNGLLSCSFYSIIFIAILDQNNNPFPKFFQPILLLFPFIGINIVFSANSGGIMVLNPAIDLGPRLYAALLIGFKPAFRDLSYSYWLLSQQISLYLGYLLGGWGYLILFGSKDLSNNLVIKVDKINDNSNENEFKNIKRSDSIGSEENRISESIPIQN